MKYKFIRLVCFSICCIVLASSSIIAQEERITNYEVVIQVNQDRSISVTEHIAVIAAGRIIRRGISRGLPRKRTFINGKTMNMSYRNKRAFRDGKPESFHTKEQNGEKVMYLGKEDVLLQPGEYQYIIEYDVPNQVEQLKEIDEIYWNAIGSDVVFPIDKASCIVRLPEEGKPLQQSCYTGVWGSTEQACVSKEWGSENEVRFQTTRPLAPYESFTIGVGFEKGIVAEPSIFERFGSTIILALSAIGLLIYFIVTWKRHGVDPPKPTPYPQFASPEGYSPASIGYIAEEKYKSGKITASIIDLAVKGHLRIEETEKTGIFTRSISYQLTKLDRSEEGLFEEEKALLDALFPYKEYIVIDGTYDARVQTASSGHQRSIHGQHKAFVSQGDNKRFLFIPILVSVLAVVAAVIVKNRFGVNLEQVAFYGLSINGIALALFMLLAVTAIIIYAYLIKQPTKEKLQLQAEIEGFKMYLEMAEKDRLNLLNPPDRTPAHFETMLPYAFALGVQHKWSAIFETILAEMAYQPDWANNRGIYTDTDFANSFGRSVSNASTPPSESSGGSGGSGGGGFSGGGGGGGSVGGW